MSTSHPPNEAVAAVLALRERDPKRYGTQAKLAKVTGLDQKSWSNYLRGVVPGRLAREAIQRKLRIPADLWDRKTSDHRNDPEDVAAPAQAAVDAKASFIGQTLTEQTTPESPVVDRDPAFSQLPTEAP